MHTSLFLILTLLCSIALANVPLDDSYVPLGYGECTDAPVSGEEKTGPPYSGANANPWIAEGVGSGSHGNTCNLKKHMPGISPLYRDLYLLAASQDLYNGKHTGRDTWNAECAPQLVNRTDAENGNMCGASCGVCMLVSGPVGSAVFMINEIADYGAVGQNGEGLNLHLDDDHSREVRLWNGVSKDISYKRVPCPVEGPIQIYFYGDWAHVAIYLVFLNHRVGIKAVYNRGSAGGDQEWVPLVRDWTNRWHWETYGCGTCPQFQKGYGGISRGSTDGTFQLKIVSVLDQELICIGLYRAGSGRLLTCVDEDGNGLQFDDPNIDLENGCNTNHTTLNLSYYDDDPSGVIGSASTLTLNLTLLLLFSLSLILSI